MLIIFDGIDGVGKTTQLELTKEALEARGIAAETSRNLGGTPIGEALRDVMLSPAERPEMANVYISAAIQEALIEVINAKLEAGATILMDRGPLSLAAYEIHGSGLDQATVWPYVEDGMARLKPDLYVIYEADIGTSLERARRRSDKADYFESKDLEYFKRVADGYRHAGARFKDSAIFINADRPIEEIQKDTQQAISKLL